MRDRFLLLTVCLLFQSVLHAQMTDEKEYLILTFGRERNKFPQHGVEEYYWIVPVDSITEGDFPIYPFFIDGVANNKIAECRKGNVIDPFVLTRGDSFDYDSSYEESVNKLFKIVREKRVKVQEIRKTWTNNYREKVTVYITPVNGRFCSCMLYKLKRDFKYEGILFIPDFSAFRFSKEFTISKKMKFVKYFDFSTILFRFQY